MPNTLYIFGNGFDLHHGLSTSYYDFAKYLQEHHRSINFLLESHFSYPSSDKDLWRRFEENLANIDIDSILDDNSEYLPNIASDEFRDRDLHAFPVVMDEIVRNLTENLIAAFKQFILQVEIPKSAEELKLKVDKNSFFFSFNYTDTIERLYNIEYNKIMFIHNSAKNKYEDIVLGHGREPETFKEKRPEPPNGLNYEEMEQWYQQNDNWDYSLDTGKENLMKYFLHSYKPTKEIIERNKSYFQSLSSVENVFVLGHSLSEIDMPYFVEIKNSIKADSKWTVSYYEPKDLKLHLNSLFDLGIEKQNISLVELQDLQLNNNQMKLFDK
jgi:hypothetical protein